MVWLKICVQEGNLIFPLPERKFLTFNHGQFLVLMSKDCSPEVWVVFVSLSMGFIDLFQGLKNAPEKLFSNNLLCSG